jgi:hypothetical protein
VKLDTRFSNTNIKILLLYSGFHLKNTFVLVCIYNNVIFVVAKAPSAVEKFQDLFYQIHSVGAIFVSSLGRVKTECGHCWKLLFWIQKISDSLFHTTAAATACMLLHERMFVVAAVYIFCICVTEVVVNVSRLFSFVSSLRERVFWGRPRHR